MANGDNTLPDKPVLQSRKFIAFLVGEATWKIILVVLLIMGIKASSIDMFLGTIALAIVVVAGAMEALYIGGQAGIDKYTRIAEIAAGAGQSFSFGTVKTTNGNGAPKPKLVSEPPELPAEEVTPNEG